MTTPRALWCGLLCLSICVLVSQGLAIVAPFLIPLFWLGKPKQKNEIERHLETMNNAIFELRQTIESKNDDKK